MKYLILLDRKFPYKSGESFLENEINEISKYFDKIMIFPIDVAIDAEKTREILSENVELFPTGKKDFQKSKIEYLLGSSKFIFSTKNEAKGLKNKLFESYYLSICEKKTAEIMDVLKKISFTSDDEVYLYSYWLYTTSSIPNLIQFPVEK